MPPKPSPPLERFWPKVDMTSTCWVWTASQFRSGYGKFYFEGRAQEAHRAAYQLLVGPIPEGLVIDHLCRNRLCVNPAHLEPVTSVENVMRGESVPARRARQSHCKRGHEFTVANTYVSKRGHRTCRRCHADNMARRRRA